MKLKLNSVSLESFLLDSSPRDFPQLLLNTVDPHPIVDFDGVRYRGPAFSPRDVHISCCHCRCLPFGFLRLGGNFLAVAVSIQSLVFAVPLHQQKSLPGDKQRDISETSRDMGACYMLQKSPKGYTKGSSSFGQVAQPHAGSQASQIGQGCRFFDLIRYLPWFAHLIIRFGRVGGG